MSMDGHEKKQSGAKAVPYINVTPLIDVLLVVLIIFMVITPLKTEPVSGRYSHPEGSKRRSESTKAQSTDSGGFDLQRSSAQAQPGQRWDR